MIQLFRKHLYIFGVPWICGFVVGTQGYSKILLDIPIVQVVVDLITALLPWIQQAALRSFEAQTTMLVHAIVWIPFPFYVWAIGGSLYRGDGLLLNRNSMLYRPCRTIKEYAVTLLGAVVFGGIGLFFLILFDGSDNSFSAFLKSRLFFSMFAQFFPIVTALALSASALAARRLVIDLSGNSNS